MDNVKDKAIYGVLAVILLITSLTLILQMHDSFRNSNQLPYTPDMTVVPQATPAPEESPLLANKNLSRPFTGSVVMVAEDGTYLRLSVLEEGTLSIGVTPDTLITTMAGDAITLEEIEPFAEAALEVIPLENSQMYDFLAVSVVVKTSADLTPEERTKRTQERIELFDNQI